MAGRFSMSTASRPKSKISQCKRRHFVGVGYGYSLRIRVLFGGESEVKEVDQERDSLGKATVDALIDLAIRELSVGDSQAKAAIHRLSETYDALSDEIARQLTKQESSLLDDYANALMDTNNHEYRYLYVQGIKDCIRFLINLKMLQ